MATVGKGAWVQGPNGLQWVGGSGDLPGAPHPPPPQGSAGAPSGGGDPAAAQPAYNSPQIPFATTTPGFNGNGGATPGYGTQSPNFLGTGQYVAPLMPINDAAITGNPTQGASKNYGLNDVWSNLNKEIANAPNQGAQMAHAALVSPASYTAATGAAAQGTASAYQAAQAQAAQGQAMYGQAAQIQGPAQGGYAMSGPVGISTAGDRAWQGQQHGLANTLQTQANGGGVSAADLQLARGGEQNIAGQLAVLGSQRGTTNAALAQRSAADQTMAIQAQTNQQMGIQRAQETAQAQQALGSVLGTARGQSQGYNLNSAQLAQQTAMQNAANAQQATLANTGYRQQVGIENANLAQQQVLANQQAGNAMTGLDVGNLQQSNLTNAGALNSAYSQNSGQAQGMTQANMAAQNAMTSGNLSALNSANLGNAQLGQQGNLANQGATDQIALANQNTQSSNAALQNQIIQSSLGAQTGIAEGSRAAALADQQLQLQQMLATGQINEQAYAAASQGSANLTGAVIGGAASLIGAGINAAKSGSSGSGGSSSTPTVDQANAGAAATTANLNGGYDSGLSGHLQGDFTGIGSSGQPATGAPTVAAAQPLDLFGGGQPVTPTQAVSDENLKTGIEGGNPMMRSFLNNYHAATAAKEPTINVTEGSGFRNPSAGGPAGVTGGSAGGGGTGKVVGSTVGGIAGGFLGPVGALAGSFIGGLFGGAAGDAIDPATAGRRVAGAGGNPGSGITIDESQWEQPNGDPNADPATAVSDENEKSAVTSGNRGMQAFLEQANAQQGAQANQGGQSNAFMQTGAPPSAQVDTKLPPWLAGNASQAQAYSGAPAWQQDPNAGYGQQQDWQSPEGGGASWGSQVDQGGTYGGGVSSMGGAGGGGFTNGGVSGGGVTNAGSYNAGGWSNGNPVAAPMFSARTSQQEMQGQPITRGLPTLPPGQTYGPPPGTSFAPHYGPPPGTSFAPHYGPPPGTSFAPHPQQPPPFRPFPIISDEREKSVVGSGSGNIQDMLDQLQAYKYRYKDPNMPGAATGKRLGVMAQDLERSPLGSQFVEEDPQGHKVVNYGQMAGTMMAGQAMMNDRLNSHEEMLKQLTGKKKR